MIPEGFFCTITQFAVANIPSKETLKTRNDKNYRYRPTFKLKSCYRYNPPFQGELRILESKWCFQIYSTNSKSCDMSFGTIDCHFWTFVNTIINLVWTFRAYWTETSKSCFEGFLSPSPESFIMTISPPSSLSFRPPRPPRPSRPSRSSHPSPSLSFPAG